MLPQPQPATAACAGNGRELARLQSPASLCRSCCAGRLTRPRCQAVPQDDAAGESPVTALSPHPRAPRDARTWTRPAKRCARA